MSTVLLLTRLKTESMKRILLFLVFHLICSCLWASQTTRKVVYSESQGMNLWHITKMLQDKTGFMWISSWEGLTRFDGYHFVTFKSKAGDGSPLMSNRIRDIELASNGNIYCMVDERWFLFSLEQGAFFSISDAENRALTNQKKQRAVLVNKKKKIKTSSRKIVDRQGVAWEIEGDSIIKTISVRSPAVPWTLPKPTQVRCFYIDSDSNYWLTTKEDQLVALYDKTNRFSGYLTPSGDLSSVCTSFSSSVYCMLQVSEDVYILGTKPDGLYRLKRKDNGFAVQHISLGTTEANSIYDLKKDRKGRIWVATFDGIYCLADNRIEQVAQTVGWRVRNLYITEDHIMLAATTGGLAIGKMPEKKISRMSMNLHVREAHRKNSLSNNATMDILNLPGQQFFVSTESGGINKILSRDLLSKNLEFAHYDKANGLATDVIVAMSPYRKEWIWVVGGNCLMMLNVKTGETRSYDESFFGKIHRYSDAHPMCLPDGRWVFGLLNGAFSVSGEKMFAKQQKSNLVFTSIRLDNDSVCYAVSHLRELKMNSNQRNLQIGFSSLDYTDTENVRYAYRLHQQDKWNYIGREHMLTLSDMQPGDYQLQVMCTGIMGTWIPQVRTLEIHVTPKFSETVWARLLGILLVVVFLLVAAYIYLYIRNVKRKQQETLTAYLTLLENRDRQVVDVRVDNTKTSLQIAVDEEDDVMMKRVILFIESHLSDSEIGIVEMSEAAAVSRSSLNRKMKKMLGLTPAEFLRETRIKHAQRFLLESNKGVSEIAYACGFTDPKYFGKTFKVITGMSPSEYRQKAKNT